MADRTEHPQHQRRAQQTVGGTVIAIGGTVLALAALWLDNSSAVLIGLVAALIGAGRVEPSMLLSAWKEWKR